MIYRRCAKSDNQIDDSERRVLRINMVSSLVMNIIDFAMIIWGAVVVFGAWTTWTDDIEKYMADKDGWNYCKKTPMIFAFSILITKWVSSMEQHIGI